MRVASVGRAESQNGVEIKAQKKDMKEGKVEEKRRNRGTQSAGPWSVKGLR